MHRFWGIDEMVRMVASDLEDHCKASGSALALACCSKQLSDIVLDILWEWLEGLSWLMRCLPQETWETRNGEFVFLRCPSTEEWIRFSSYARRVRTFRSHGVLGSSDVSLTAYHLLSMQTPTLGPHVLPNLRSINWTCSSWDAAPLLRLFLSPELIDIDIGFPNGDPHIYRPATISLIPARNLTNLRLECMAFGDPLPMDELHNLLEQASETLRSVDLDGELSDSIMEKLLQLPNLRHLDLRLPGTRIALPAVVFPSLEKLLVSCGESTWWLHALQNIQSPAFRELDVYLAGSSPTHLQALGPSLLDANIEQTLISLNFDSLVRIPLTEAGLRPFISFGKLTNLDLLSPCTEEGCSFQLNDSIISELAVALPRLTHLGLGGAPCEAATSDVTITSLVALSINCVDLDFLRLHFNANGIISRDAHENSQTHKFTCKLRTLTMGSQPLPSNQDDVLLLTFTILHIFPHLEEILAEGQGWGQVGQAVGLFRKAKKIIPFP